MELEQANEQSIEKFQEIEALLHKNCLLEQKVTKLNADLIVQNEEHEGAIEFKHYEYKKKSEKNKSLEK